MYQKDHLAAEFILCKLQRSWCYPNPALWCIYMIMHNDSTSQCVTHSALNQDMASKWGYCLGKTFVPL